MEITKKQYRELLNKQDAESRQLAKDSNGQGASGRYKPTKRLYGDYLYSQDREMFNFAYNEHIKKMNEES